MSANASTVPEFTLAGSSRRAQPQGVLFSFFLAASVLTVAGNLLVVALVSAAAALQSPVYFFLRTPSALEISYTSVTLPLLLHQLRTGQRHIPRSGCALQMFFFLFVGATECCLLAAMAYDRYAAICAPLRYPLLLSRRKCLGLAGSAWACGAMVILAAALLILCPFGLILGSYRRILATVSRIPSAAGRRKAFSTCSSHLVVVSVFYGTAVFTYIRPKAGYDPATDPLVSLFYAVVTPILNPIIYSLWNTDVKAALRRTIQKMGPAKI
ncbi:olfactory receptor 10C1 [Camelus ferus]|nr:olfactory receptor 10C1 [Camelus ferus]